MLFKYLPFDDQVQLKIPLETEAKLYIQQRILDKAYELAWSYVLDYENSLNPYDERRNMVAPWRDIAVIYSDRLGVENTRKLHLNCFRNNRISKAYVNTQYIGSITKQTAYLQPDSGILCIFCNILNSHHIY
jgi:hypothetical protein